MAVNRTKVLEAAQKFLSKGQYDKAVGEYQKLVAEDPRDVRTLLKIGDLHTRRHKPKDAIEVYERVADLYAKQGFFLKAVAVYKQILKLDPAHLDATQKLAKMYEELALTSDALSTYDLVAEAFMNRGDTQKALETMARMIEIDGQNVAVRIKYAEALSKAGKAQDAATAFAAGAALLKEQGRMDDYLRVVERQLYHDPESVPIARELAGLYIERSDPKRALAKLQVCFKADPRDVQTLEMLAEAFRQLGQSAKTISVLKEIVRLHVESGDDEARIRAVERVLELDPNDAESLQALAGGKVAPPKSVEVPAHPTAAPPRRPGPPPPPVVQAPPLDDTQEDEIEIEESEELDLIEESESESTDDVLIVDDAPLDDAPLDDASLDEAPLDDARFDEPPRDEPSVTPTESTPDDQVHALLADADMREGAGDYEGAISALQLVLSIEPDHVAAHERLKDIYIAADRRVDAVKELLWLSSACEDASRDRAVEYAESAYELAPRSDATRRRLSALGALPDDAAGGRGVDAPLDEPSRADRVAPLLAPESLGPGELEASESLEPGAVEPTLAGEDAASLLELPISPEEFDAEPPRPGRSAFTQAQLGELLELTISPEEFDAAAPTPPSVELPSPFASTEFAPFGPPSSSREGVAPRPPPKGSPATGRDRGLPPPRLPEARPSLPARPGPEGALPPPPAFRPAPPAALGRPSTPVDDSHDPTVPGAEVPESLREAPAPRSARSEPPLPSVGAQVPAAKPASVPPPGMLSMPRPSLASDVPADVEEVLDEAAFFASQGMYDEALELVQEAILIYPTSTQLKERLVEYEHQADLRDDAPEPTPERDQSFDIAEQLAMQPASPDAPSTDEMVDVESVFAQFKKGVAEQIAPDDSETHFDLGIAYKEMGLIDDAISEFELAAKSQKRACTALTMIGTCHLERGDGRRAIGYFERAQKLEHHAPGEELALHFEIGNAHEQLGELDQALAAYERVASRDRTFRGVSARLEQLRKRGIKPARASR